MTVTVQDSAYCNTHFRFGNPNIYMINGNAEDSPLLNDIVDGGFAGVRERWDPNNANQKKAFDFLVSKGLGLMVFIGDVNSSREQDSADLDALAARYGSAARFVCGPNEINETAIDPNGPWAGFSWVDIAYLKMRHIQNRIERLLPELYGSTIVTPSLKYYVDDYQADLDAVQARDVGQWCKAGDVHYYPGHNGPNGLKGGKTILQEVARAQTAWGCDSMIMSETGYTNGDATNRLTEAEAAVFIPQTFQQNAAAGVLATAVYEFANEKPPKNTLTDHEGQFGVWHKPAYDACKSLLVP